MLWPEEEDKYFEHSTIILFEFFNKLSLEMRLEKVDEK